MTARESMTRTGQHADLDDPQATVARRRLLRRKGFLRMVYLEWYRTMLDAAPDGSGPVLEIGSGAGFLRDLDRRGITSDVLAVPHVDLTASATRLPFTAGSLRAILMTNVLHHVPDPEAFFAEAALCVRPGGAIVMIEPWLTSWSRFVYQYLHHELLAPSAPDWRIPHGGPLSAANIALPWILFERDREAFRYRCAPWRVERIRPFMPFAYLISGGMSWPGLLPASAYGCWRWLERSVRVDRRLAMFALIVLRNAYGGA